MTLRTKQIEKRIAELVTEENKERLVFARGVTKFSIECLIDNLAYIHQLQVERETLEWVLEGGE